jgi:glycosyltransferase involved in cell wall biosynthesis
MSGMRVALLQDRFAVDGRSRLAMAMIEVLNRHGLTPDLITFSAPADCVRVARRLGKAAARFDVRGPRVGVAAPRGYLYRMLLFQVAVRALVRPYDLVIGCNGALEILPPGPSYLHYIHFPFEGHVECNPRYQTWPMSAYAAGALWCLRRLRRHDPAALGDARILTNSEFSRGVLLRHYPIDPSRVRVLYPPAMPVDLRRVAPAWARRGVVSVGTFSPNKRQHEQLRIASLLPDVEFRIAGSVQSRRYYRACVARVRRERLVNVRLLPDLPPGAVAQLYGGAQAFVHSMRFEPFGIATVEAIQHGCLPVVHDSGGQREVVPLPALRYDDVEEAVDVIARTVAKPFGADPDFGDEARTLLVRRATRFTEAHFGSQFSRVLASGGFVTEGTDAVDAAHRADRA